MTHYLDRMISVVSRATNHVPFATVTIREALDEILSGKYESYVQRVRGIEDKERRRKVKATGPAYTFCGTFSYVNKQGLSQPSGTICIDYDDLDDVAAAKTQLEQNPHVLGYFVSTSGHLSNGLKVLMTLATAPTTNDENHVAYEQCAALLGIGTADRGAKDICRLCYTSSDPDLYINEDATPVEVDYTVTRRDVGTASADRERLAQVGAVLPDGEKYTLLRGITGVLRGYGVHPEIIRTMIHAAHENHGQSVGDRAPLDKLIDDAYAWDVDPDRSLTQMVRTFLAAEGAEKETAQEAMPWVSMPLGVFPAQVERYIRECANAIDCDPSMVALPVLVTLGAAIGNSYRLAIKQQWLVNATLWGVTILPSGSAKSPALDAAIRPVIHQERSAAKRFAEDRERYEGMSKEEKAQERRPIRQRYRLADSTLETAQFVHADTPRGLFMVRDELDAWYGSLDKYSGGSSDIASWIELHGGRATSVDRKSDKERPTLDLPYPAVCLAGTIQPRTYQERITPALMSSGLDHRLLKVMPPFKSLRYTDDEPSETAVRQYDSLVNRLYALPFDVEHGAKVIGMSREAKAAFKQFKNRVADEIERLPDIPIRSFFAKLDNLAAQFALVFHIADEVSERSEQHGEAIGPVTEDAMLRGIRLAAYFSYEVPRIHQELDLSRQVMDKDAARCLDLPTPFTREDVMRVWGVQKRQANNIIDKLERKRYVQPSEGKGNYERLITHCATSFSALWTEYRDQIALKRQKRQSGNGQSPSETLSDAEVPEEAANTPVIPNMGLITSTDSSWEVL